MRGLWGIWTKKSAQTQGREAKGENGEEGWLGVLSAEDIGPQHGLEAGEAASCHGSVWYDAPTVPASSHILLSRILCCFVPLLLKPWAWVVWNKSLLPPPLPNPGQALIQ